MGFSLATWNINSVRLRIDLVRRFLRQEKPDILCLQETKARPEQVEKELAQVAGYRHHPAIRAPVAV